jgi:hypothetical protein
VGAVDNEFADELGRRDEDVENQPPAGLVDPPITMQTWIVRQPVARGTVTAVADTIAASFGID